MPALSRRWTAILLLAALCSGALAWAVAPTADRRPLHVILVDDPPATPPPAVAAITGAVQHAGAYPLSPGERLADLVSAAGGLTPDADVRRINLARRIHDGEQVDVPVIDAALSAPVKVRINRASRAELLALPGMTVQQAASIQNSVRKQGPVRSPDDLVERGLSSPEEAQRFSTLIDWSP